jgi:hypothetical protein
MPRRGSVPRCEKRFNGKPGSIAGGVPARNLQLQAVVIPEQRLSTIEPAADGGRVTATGKARPCASVRESLATSNTEGRLSSAKKPEAVRMQCVFYLRGYRQHCEAHKALGRGAMEEGEPERLQRSFCSTGTFLQCPIFRGLEKRLRMRSINDS